MDDNKEEQEKENDQAEKQPDPVKDEAANAAESPEDAGDEKSTEAPQSGDDSKKADASASAGPSRPDGATDQQDASKPASEDTAGSAAKAEDSSEQTEQKGIFGRKKKEKDKRDQQIEDLTDRCQRQMAEFDNFRKRSEKEKSAMFEMGERSVLEKILPTVDNFERGLSSLDEEKKEDAFAQGMEKTYRQLVTALEGIGVKPIEALGQPFDPNFHNAVQHVDDEDAGENIVVEEFQKGYMYRDTVLRHSMVKVAN